MDSLSLDLIQTLIFLFPGIVAYLVYRTLVESPAWSTIEIIIFSFVFALIGNVASGAMTGVSILSVNADQAIEIGKVAVTLRGLLFTTGFAAGPALLLALLRIHGGLFGTLRFIGVTYRTGRSNVWHDVFSDYRGKWVEVELANGDKIIGWPKYYSTTDGALELFLADASYVTDAGLLDVQGPGVYINGNENVVRVAILH